MSNHRVVTTVQGGVAHVHLNRQEKRNGLDLPMFEAILAAAARVVADRSVRVVVLSGEGKAFCAGLDWLAFAQEPPETTGRMLARDEAVSPANLAQRICWIWRECPVPVLAAVQGAAFGGGLQLALGADLRFVGPDAQLSVMEVRYGLIPDMGASKTLLSVVRADIAKELLFTGRVVGAEEAVALGLATRLVPDPLVAAMELAEVIAARSPDAIRAGKRLIDEAPWLSVRDAFALETELQLKLIGSANQAAAVHAVFTGALPTFDDPQGP